MAEIAEGFNGKNLSIRFDAHGITRDIGITIEQEGLNTGTEKVIQRYETLSYATLDEIIQLRNELNKVILEVVGL